MNPVHLVLIAELWLVLFCAAALHWQQRRSVGPAVFWAGVAVGWVLLSISAAVALNLVEEAPPSPGARVLPALLAPAVLGLIVATVLTLGRRTDR